MSKKFPLDRKNYRLMEENQKEIAQGKKERLKEHIDDLKDNMTVQPPKFAEPIP
jgi:hypothetical protein